MSAIDRLAPGGNVSWDLKMMPTIKKCLLSSVHYIEVLLYH